MISLEEWQQEWDRVLLNISGAADEAMKAIAYKAAAETAEKGLQHYALEWYELDNNALPEAVYVLKNLSHIEDPLYKEVALPVLLKALDGVAFEDWGEGEEKESLMVGQSMTEWEVRSALMHRPEQDRGRVLWLHREFSGGVPRDEDMKYWNFNDTLDDDLMKKRDRFEKMIEWMQSQMPEEHISHFGEASMEDFHLSNEVWTRQLNEWKSHMMNLLQKSMKDMIIGRKKWAADGCGVGVDGDSLAEMLHHCMWARMKVSEFFEREELVGSALAAVDKEVGIVSKGGNPYGGISLAVIGASGCGKTALMAKVAAELFKREKEKSTSHRPVIVRFCGTSAGSVTGMALVQSICLQLYLVLGLTSKERKKLLEMDYKEVVTHLQELLSEHAVILLIDSLDQLQNENLARSDISFLKGVRPHPNTRIIVSALPDDLIEGIRIHNNDPSLWT
jgi:Cdc6-like AAA superfamily ATPase